MSVETSEKVLLLEEFLNVSGLDGWEMLGVAAAPGTTFTHLVYLKRRVELVKSAQSGLPDLLDE